MSYKLLPFLQVILGGGRRHFLPRREPDSKNADTSGWREDGKNLIEEWQQDKKKRGLAYKYISRKRELDKIDPLKVDYLLGKETLTIKLKIHIHNCCLGYTLIYLLL